MARRSGLAGVSKLRRKLRRMPEEARDEARAGVAEAAELVRFEQLARVPVRTGDLAASIEVRLGSDKLSAEIGPGAKTKRAKRLAGWRAKFIEFGTRNAPARPFIFPGYEAAREGAITLIGRGVDRALKKVARDDRGE